MRAGVFLCPGDTCQLDRVDFSIFLVNFFRSSARIAIWYFGFGILELNGLELYL